MNIDELTRTAQVTYANHPGMEPMRAAVLRVIAEVRAMVPEPFADGEFPTLGWNDACAEMLRRLDAITGGK